MPHTPEVIVNPGETELVPLQFEGERRAMIMLLLDSYEGVTAGFGDTPLVVEDMLGAETMGAALVDPVDGNLEVANAGSSKIRGAVIVILDSPRRMIVSVEPAVIVFGEAVEITVTLTEFNPGDQPEVLVTYSDDSPPIELTLAPDSPGEWTAAFTPEKSGTHSVFAQVDGMRPRFANSWIQVDVDAPAPGSPGGGD